MTGTSQPSSARRRTISGRAAAASSLFTVTRTSCDPLRASAATCSAVARASAVSVFVIDWTTIGWLLPTGTSPIQVVTVCLRSRRDTDISRRDVVPSFRLKAIRYAVVLVFSADVQKLSRKGWICKTWEGELAQVSLPGAMPQQWSFSVRNDSIARVITETEGSHVTLTYDERRGLPSSCFGDTHYFVTGVRVLGQ